jgi:hypothetical protein
MGSVHDIKTGAVKSRQIGNDKVKSKDIRDDGGVKSQDVKDDSLLGEDIDEDSLGTVPSSLSAEQLDGHSINRLSATTTNDGAEQTVDLGLGFSLQLTCPSGVTKIDLTSAPGNPDSIVRARASTFTSKMETDTVDLTPIRGGDDFPLWDTDEGFQIDGNIELVIRRQDGTGVTAMVGHADSSNDNPFGVAGCALGGKSIAG